MLDFILSKMNMLILVTAIFAIVSFFMFNLSYLTTVEESRLLVSRVANQSYTLVNSPSYCDSSYYFMPGVISVPGTDFYYAMKISKVETEKETSDGETQKLNYLIFSIFPRTDLTKAVASDSIVTSANVRLFGFDEHGEITDVTEQGTILDPQARNPVNAFVIIKEIEKGIQNFYLIPCSTSRIICDSIKQQVAEKIFETRPEKAFYC